MVSRKQKRPRGSLKCQVVCQRTPDGIKCLKILIFSPSKCLTLCGLPPIIISLVVTKGLYCLGGDWFKRHNAKAKVPLTDRRRIVTLISSSKTLWSSN